MSMTVFGIASHISALGWLLIGAGLVVWFLSVLIVLEDLKKKSNQAFLALTSVVLLWGIGYAVFEVARAAGFADGALTLLYCVGGLIAPAALFLSYAFSHENDTHNFQKIGIVLLPYVLIIGLSYIPEFFVSYHTVTQTLSFGLGFVLYALYSTLALSGSLYFLIKKYRESAGIFNLELRTLIIIFISASIIGLGLSFVVPCVTGNLDLFWVGYMAIAIFLILVGLSIIRYTFLSFKVIATEFFISFVGVILLVELFFATSVFDLLLRTIIAILILFSSFFLVGSVEREFESRDKIARLLRDLDQINGRLIVLDKKKSEFLSTASHHLRDPLTSIQGYASMLTEGSFGAVTPMTKEALGKIFESSKRLVTIISDFLDISNIENGDMKYIFEPVDVKKMVSELVDDLRPAAEHAGLTLGLEVKGGARAKYVANADVTKLRQVVSNLIDNSIKYTPKGSVVVNLSKDAKTSKILVAIKDTGIGMSADTLQKIFKKFSRAEGVSKVYTEGTGLGLYVAKEIVKKHNGRIWAESDGEGKGSSFNLELELTK